MSEYVPYIPEEIILTENDQILGLYCQICASTFSMLENGTSPQMVEAVATSHMKVHDEPVTINIFNYESFLQ